MSSNNIINTTTNKASCASGVDVVLQLGDGVPVTRRLEPISSLCAQDPAPKLARHIQNSEVRRNPYVPKTFSIVDKPFPSRIALRETTSIPLTAAHLRRSAFQTGSKVRRCRRVTPKVGSSDDSSENNEDAAYVWQAPPAWEDANPKDIVHDPRLCREVGGQWAVVPSKVVTRFEANPQTATPQIPAYAHTSWSHVKCSHELKAFLSLKRFQKGIPASMSASQRLLSTIASHPTGYFPPNTTCFPKLYVAVNGEEGCPSLVIEAAVHPLDTLHDLRQRIAEELSQRSGSNYTSQIRFTFTEFEPPVLAWLGSLQRSFETHLKERDLLHAQGDTAVKELRQQIKQHRATARTICACISEIRRTLEKRIPVAQILQRIQVPKISRRRGLPRQDTYYPYQPILPIAANRHLFKRLGLSKLELRGLIGGGVTAAVMAELVRMEAALVEGKDESSVGARMRFGFEKKTTPPPSSIPQLEAPRFTFRKAALEVIRRIRWSKARKLHDAVLGELYKRHLLQLAKPPSTGPSRLPPRVLAEQERVAKMQFPSELLLPIVRITIDENQLAPSEEALIAASQTLSSTFSKPQPAARIKQYTIVSALVDSINANARNQQDSKDNKKRGITFQSGEDEVSRSALDEDAILKVIEEALSGEGSSSDVPLDWRDVSGMSLLHYAVLQRAPRVLALLCQHGADPSFEIVATGDTVLHFILRNRAPVHTKVQLVSAVLDSCGTTMTYTLLRCRNRLGETPLLLACRMAEGCKEEVVLVKLLCAGKDAALRNLSPKRAFATTVTDSTLDTLEEERVATVLSLAKAVDEIDMPTIQWWLEERGGPVPTQEVPLLCLALQSRPSPQRDPAEAIALWNEMFAYLLRRHDQSPNDRDQGGRNAFHYAARSSCLDCIEPMMDNVCDPNRASLSGGCSDDVSVSLTMAERTILHQKKQAATALAQDYECKQTFLHTMLEWCSVAAMEAFAPALFAHPMIAIYGVNAVQPATTDHFGNTLLHWCMLRRTSTLAAHFIRPVEFENAAGVEAFLSVRNADGDAPLGCAIRSRFADGIAMLLSRSVVLEVALRIPNSRDRLPLLMAVDCMIAYEAFGGQHTAVMDERPHCAVRGSTNTVHTLLKIISRSDNKEEVVNACSGTSSDTALHSAISRGAWHIAAQLFTSLASCNVPNRYGITARRLACADADDIALARLVLGNDRSAATNGEALMECVECGGAAAFNLRLLDEFFFSRSSFELNKTMLGYTLLKASARTGNIVLMKALLERGARELPEAASALEGGDESQKTGAVLALLLRSIRIARATNNLTRHEREANFVSPVRRGGTVTGVPHANIKQFMSEEGMVAAEALCVLLIRLNFRLTKTVLVDAISCGMPNVAVAVLESMDCDHTMVDYHDIEMGNTPLHMACDACGVGSADPKWIDVAFALCDRTGNVGALNTSGESALGIALKRNVPLLAIRLVLSGHLFAAVKRDYCLVIQGSDSNLRASIRHQAFLSTVWIRQRSAMARAGMLAEAVCGGRMDIVDMFAVAAQRTERHSFAELLMAPFDKSSGAFRSLTAALGDSDLVSLDCVLSIAAANVTPSILGASLAYCFDSEETKPTNVSYGCLRAAAMAAITAGKIRNAEMLIDRMVDMTPPSPNTDSFRVYCRYPSLLHAIAATKHKSRRLLRLFRSLLREGIDLEGVSTPINTNNDPLEASNQQLHPTAASVNSVEGIAGFSLRLDPAALANKDERFLHVLPSHALDIMLLVLKGLSAHGVHLPTEEDIGTEDKDVYEAELLEALEDGLYTDISDEDEFGVENESVHGYRQPQTRKPHIRRHRSDLDPQVIAPITPSGVSDAMLRALLQCLTKDDLHDPTPESDDDENKMVEGHHPTDFFAERQREKINPGMAGAGGAFDEGREGDVGGEFGGGGSSSELPSEQNGVGGWDNTNHKISIAPEPLSMIPTIAVDAYDGSGYEGSNAHGSVNPSADVQGQITTPTNNDNSGAATKQLTQGGGGGGGGLLLGAGNTGHWSLLSQVSDLAATVKERAVQLQEEENARQIPHNSFVASFTMETLELVLRHDLTHTLNLVLSQTKRFPQINGNLSQHVFTNGQRLLNAAMQKTVPNTVIKKAIDAARNEALSWREHGTWWVETLLDVRHPELVRRIPASVRTKNPFLCLFRDISRSDPTTAACLDENVDEDTPLHSAVRFNRPKVVAHILQSTCVEVDVNARNARGRTALALAARLNRMESASQLVSTGVDLLVEDEDGMTALHHAAAAGAGNIVELLLADDDGPEVACNPSTKPLSSFPVLKALQHGKDDCALELLTSHATERTPFDIRLTTSGETLLHFAAANNCTLTMDTLIKRCVENRMESYLHRKSHAGYSCRDYCTPHSSADGLLERAGVKRVLTAGGGQFSLAKRLTARDTDYYKSPLANKLPDIPEEGLVLLANLEPEGPTTQEPSVDEAAFDAASTGRDKDLLKLLRLGGHDHVRMRAYNLPRIPTSDKDKATMGKELAAALGRFGGVRGAVTFDTSSSPHGTPASVSSSPAKGQRRRSETTLNSSQPFARLRLTDPDRVADVIAAENVMVRQLPISFIPDSPQGPAYRTETVPGRTSLLHHICSTGCHESLAFVIESNSTHGVVSKAILGLLGKHVDEGGFTPYHLAVMNRRWSCVSLLIRAHVTQSAWIPREYATTPDIFTSMKLPPNALFTPLRCFPTEMDRHVMGLHAPSSFWSFDKTASWRQTEEVFGILQSRHQAGIINNTTDDWKQVVATTNYEGGAIFYAKILKCEPDEEDKGVFTTASHEDALARSRRALQRRYAQVPPEISRLSRDIINTNLEKVVPAAISSCKNRLLTEALVVPTNFSTIPQQCQELFECLRSVIVDLNIHTDIEEADARDIALERERLKAAFLYHVDGGSLYAQFEEAVRTLSSGEYGTFGWIALKKLCSIELLPSRAPEQAAPQYANVRREPPAATRLRIAEAKALEAATQDSDDDYDLEESIDEKTGEIVSRLKKKIRVSDDDLGLDDAVNGGGYGSVHLRLPFYAGARYLTCPPVLESLKDYFVCEAVSAGYDLIEMISVARKTTHKGLLLNLFVCDKLPMMIHRLLSSLSSGIFEAVPKEQNQQQQQQQRRLSTTNRDNSRRVSTISLASGPSPSEAANNDIPAVDTVMAEIRSALSKTTESSAASIAMQIRHVSKILSLVFASSICPCRTTSGAVDSSAYTVTLGGTAPTFALNPLQTTVDVIVVFGEEGWFSSDSNQTSTSPPTISEYQQTLSDILESVMDPSHVCAMTLPGRQTSSSSQHQRPQESWHGEFAVPGGAVGVGAPMSNPSRLTIHDSVPITDSRVVLTFAAKFTKTPTTTNQDGDDVITTPTTRMSFREPHLNDMAMFRGGSWNWRRMGLYKWSLASEEGFESLTRFYKPPTTNTVNTGGGAPLDLEYMPRPNSVMSINEISISTTTDFASSSSAVASPNRKQPPPATTSRRRPKRVLGNDVRLSLAPLRLDFFDDEGPLVQSIGNALDTYREFTSMNGMSDQAAQKQYQHRGDLQSWSISQPSPSQPTFQNYASSTFLAIPGTKVSSRRSSYMHLASDLAPLEGLSGGSVELMGVALRTGGDLQSRMDRHLEAAAAEEYADGGQQLTNASFALGSDAMSMAATTAMSGLFQTPGPAGWAASGVHHPQPAAPQVGSGGLRPGALRVLLIKVLEYTDPVFMLSTAARVSSVWQAATHTLLSDGVFEDSCTSWMQYHSRLLSQQIDEERKLANWRLKEGFLVVPVGAREAVRRWLSVDSMTRQRSTRRGDAADGICTHIVASDAIDDAYMLFLQDPWTVTHWCMQVAGGPTPLLDESTKGPYSNNRIIDTIRQFYKVVASASELYYRCDHMHRSVSAAHDRIVASKRVLATDAPFASASINNTSKSALSSVSPTPLTISLPSVGGYANKLRAVTSAPATSMVPAASVGVLKPF